MPSLRSDFQEIVRILEETPQWRTARLQPPVLILGSISGIPVGFRQARHAGVIDSIIVHVAEGPLRVATLDEMIGMKAYMAYSRNAVRDYLDFAALSACMDDEAVVASLLKSDTRYGHLQTSSVALAIARRLSDPKPCDLEQVQLDAYKGLVPAWRSWPRVEECSRRFGDLLGERLVLGGAP